MPVFTISYDLIKRKDYPELWAELARIGAQRYLLSQWVVRRADGVTASALRDHLKAFVDGDDRLFIQQIDGIGWASWNALIDINKV
jgi:hypothetical protein